MNSGREKGSVVYYFAGPAIGGAVGAIVGAEYLDNPSDTPAARWEEKVDHLHNRNDQLANIKQHDLLQGYVDKHDAEVSVSHARAVNRAKIQDLQARLHNPSDDVAEIGAVASIALLGAALGVAVASGVRRAHQAATRWENDPLR